MRRVTYLVWCLAIVLLVSACSTTGSASGAVAASAPPASEPADVSAAEGDAASAALLAPDAFVIQVEPIGHWHVLNAKTLLFTVLDTEREVGVEGLDLVVQIARPDSSRITERTVADDQVMDEGDGIYSLEYTAAAIGGYALVARFQHDGQVFASEPVVFEVAKGGEEGIRVETDDNTYVYQIRYHWEPGHAHASDDEPVALVFEVMRGIQVGEAINWEQPWQNTFDHVRSAESPRVQLSVAGEVTDELAPAYMGRGIYRAERIFGADEVGDGADYEVRFTFTDPEHGAAVTHSEPYPLHLSAPH